MTCLPNFQPWVALTLALRDCTFKPLAFRALINNTKLEYKDLYFSGNPAMKQRISGVRQMTYSPWGYHAGCHGSPVIMSRPSSASNPGSRSIEKRFGMVEKKRMLLPSPASFGLKSKPSAAINATAPSGEASRPSSAAVSRSQTSMSNYKPWYVVKLKQDWN